MDCVPEVFFLVHPLTMRLCEEGEWLQGRDDCVRRGSGCREGICFGRGIPLALYEIVSR